MVVLWLLLGHIQPSSFHGSFCIFLMLFNHTGPCTIQSFLPTNCTSLPDTGIPGEMLKWQLSGSVQKQFPLCCSEVVLYKVWGLRTLHVLRRVCVWAALGTLRCSRGIQDSVMIAVSKMLILYTLVLGFLLFVSVYVTADF